VRLGILTHPSHEPSFRIRWKRHFPALEANGIEPRVLPLPFDAKDAAACDAVVLQRILLPWRVFRVLRRSARRLIYDVDDLLCYRPYPPHRSRRRKRRFFRIVGTADLVLAGNGTIARLARLRARRVLVLPSCVDVESYAPAEPLAEFTAVWIGQRVTLPHLEPVRAAVVGAGIRLRVVADAAPEGVEFVPWSEADEARRIAECHAGLMPLPSDPFSRGKGGYKVLQYFAARIPAVCSPVGVNRILAEGGARLARTPAEFVAELERLRDDPALRAELGARGRGFVERRYASAALGERLVRILKA